MTRTFFEGFGAGCRLSWSFFTTTIRSTLDALAWHEDGDDGDGNDGDNNKMTMKTHSNTQLGCAYGATPSDFYYALNSDGSWPVNSFAIIITIINKGLGILL